MSPNQWKRKVRRNQTELGSISLLAGFMSLYGDTPCLTRHFVVIVLSITPWHPVTQAAAANQNATNSSHPSSFNQSKCHKLYSMWKSWRVAAMFSPQSKAVDWKMVDSEQSFWSKSWHTFIYDKRYQLNQMRQTTFTHRCGGGRIANCAVIGSVLVSQTPVFKSGGINIFRLVQSEHE